MIRRAWALLVLVTLLGACGGSGASRTAPTTTPTSTPTGSSVGTEPTTPQPVTTAGATTTPAPGPAPAGTATTSTGGPPSCAIGPQAPPAGTVAANVATALAFAPDGRLFFAERSGTVRVVQGGQTKVFATVKTVTSEPGGGYSERGLLGLAIDPDFTHNHFVYAFYSDADRAHQDVIRWTDCGGTGTAARTLIVLPSGDDCCHKGGRLAFGPDGKLYVTLGDEHDSAAAPVTSDPRGKVLRYDSDGSVPTDNPFGAGDPVWVYGLRNPFGIAFSPSGQMALTNNGPSGEIPGGPGTGYDTVIFSAPRGGGYQWPNCYGYSHPNPDNSTCGAGRLPPDWSSETSTVVPTGATFVDQSGPAGYAGHLILCTYSGGMLIFTPGSPHGSMAPGPSQCRYDVKEGPNHALYFSDDTGIHRLG